MATHRYLAVDLGAESGRVLLGTLNQGRLKVDEIHRFPNRSVEVLGSLRWDLLALFQEIKKGLSLAAKLKVPIHSLSVDSWGVNYVLLKGREPMLSLPYHYRDRRTEGGISRATKKISRQALFAETGIQLMEINSLYQLMDDKAKRPEILKLADGFLCVADYFNYLFCGKARQEVSLASTTQLYNPLKKKWSSKLIKKFGLPAKLFPALVPGGTVLGPLLDEIAEETGLKGVKVVASCSHDTAAAVAAVPAQGSRPWAYLSSGTWSLIGVERKLPVLSAQAERLGFTNEIGINASVRFQQNCFGLYIFQECRRWWLARDLDYSYLQLTQLARKAPALRSLINPKDPRFSKPGRMPEKVQAYTKETGQKVPKTPGEITRCVLESLALQYARVLEETAFVCGSKPEILHIIGGGSQNLLLNEFCAKATGLTVIAGPAEGSGIGNLAVQAYAQGHIKDLSALRKMVGISFPTRQFKDSGGAAWAKAAATFSRLP